MELAWQVAIVDPHKLKLGMDLDHVSYCWRPYEDRPAEHRADYDRLEESMREEGQINPVIVFRGHALIGQRRTEIAQKLGWRTLKIIDIKTDITHDKTPDRVLQLKESYHAAPY